MQRRRLCWVFSFLLLASFWFPASAPRAQNLTAVLEAEIVTLDPHFTPAYITRTFGYMVFDTLFAMDGQGRVQPQMVQEWTSSPDGLVWNFTLREDLLWHDGTPVTAADCVASLRRWGSRSALGSRLMAATASLEARDARSFTLALKEPFGLVLDTLGTTSSRVPFMLPERLARMPGTERIPEIIGSGPFTYRRADHRTGDRMLLRRNAAYVPRTEPSSYLAGGKVVRIESLDIRVVPDGQTAIAAMRTGEIDFTQYAPFKLLGALERARRTRREGWSVFGVHALGVDLHSPLTNSVIGFNCTNATTGGFHCEEALTPLFVQFAAAPTLEARQAIAARMQEIVYGQAIAVPWGQFAQPAAYRAQLTNLIPSAIPLFWNVETR